MRVLVISEGRHELGLASDENGSSLRTFVCRIAEQNLSCDLRKISEPAFRSTHGKGPGFVKKAVRCLHRAREWGYDALIVLIDEDGDIDRHRQFSQAQEHILEPLPRAFGVAVRTYDAWFLADEKALSAVMGDTIGRQPDPEDIADPKQRLKGLLRDRDQSTALTDLYEEIAKIASIEVIEQRCPKGFGVFAARIRRHIRN